ncbi:MAG: endonuclease/exonuclease/phosphatase family protein [Verrucomicrobiota bacterium]
MLSLLRFAIPLSALALHALISFCFIFRPDKAAAITVFPLTVWVLAGILLCLLSGLLFKGRFALVVGLIWVVTGVLVADERHGLARLFHEKPEPGPAAPFEGKPVLRCLTLNCKGRSALSSQEILAWKPDIVFLQEQPAPQELSRLVRELFGGEGDFRTTAYCAILSRGRIFQEKRSASQRHLQVKTRFLDGREYHLVALHLLPAVTEVNLFSLDTWRAHYRNRLVRSEQVRTLARERLEFSGGLPCLLGGDFNAPAGDRAMDALNPHFQDAYPLAGTGWPNTFSNQLPLHRIDQLWLTPELRPVRQRTVRTQESDHRMVVLDFLDPREQPQAEPPTAF